VASECIDRCRKLANWLAAGRINFEEYASNVTDTIVYSPIDSIPTCVETVPPSLASSYTDYLRTLLEPVDFMPCPRPFLAEDVAEEVLNRRKLELRPKYLRLYQLRAEKGGGGGEAGTGGRRGRRRTGTPRRTGT
jgi:hypothetical protein